MDSADEESQQLGPAELALDKLASGDLPSPALAHRALAAGVAAAWSG